MYNHKRMDKRQLHHLLVQSQRIRLRYVAAVLLVCALTAAFALRHNYSHMVELKQAVFAADKRGSDVETALQDLQVYVTAHMNTQLSTGSDVYPPIQLKYTYDRLVKAESDNLATTNQQLYNDAQKYCEARDSTDFSGRNRVPCIQAYVKDHGAPLKTIPDSLYKFDFVSPVWSPDLAGWSIVASVLSVILLAGLAALRWWLKRASR
jgi:hypothetical protein